MTTTRATTSTAVRGYGAVNAALGLVTVARARRIAAVVAGDTGPAPDARIVRVLGARQLAQGSLLVVRPVATSIGAGVFADLSHALSMIGLAAVVGRYRRPAIISAAVATGSVVIGGTLLRGTGWKSDTKARVGHI